MTIEPPEQLDLVAVAPISIWLSIWKRVNSGMSSV
jgi:hypothetical protein